MNPAIQHDPALSAMFDAQREQSRKDGVVPWQTRAEFGGLLADLAARYLSQNELCIVNGGVETGRTFGALLFDHLLFTGSTAVGHQLIMRPATN